MEKFIKNKYAFSKIPGLLSVGVEFEKVRQGQLSRLRKEVYLYDVHMRELVSLRPTYEERNLLLNLSFFIIGDIEQLEFLHERRRLNSNLLSARSRINKKFIEKWNGYIILYTILFSNPNYKLIQDYFRIIDVKQNREAKAIVVAEKNNKKKGLVIKKNKRSINIITSSGEILKLKLDEVEIGEEYEGIEKGFFRKNKLKLMMGFIGACVLIGGFMHYYYERSITVMIETTSTIKLETNRFKRTIYSSSGTDKGKLLLEDIKPMGDSLDESVLKTLTYANENKMIPEKGILITISGEPINMETLKKTGEYIYKHKINVDINNGGTQHKLYQIIKNQKEEKNEQK